MGRKWKRPAAMSSLIVPDDLDNNDENGMVEYSIKKYEKTLPTYQQNYRSQHPALYNPPKTKLVTAFDNQRKLWNKADVEAEIELLKSEGYIIGAKVVTTYGAEGIIRGFRKLYEEEMAFYGQPTLISILRDEGYSSEHVYYRKEEVKLL